MSIKFALEIGPGQHPAAKEGDGYSWLTVDHPCNFRDGANGYFAEWGSEMLPLRDDGLDLVYASHVLEHVPWNRTGQALAEAFRVLKPGGTIEIWVPNFAYLMQCYSEQRCGDDWRRDNPNNDPMTWLNGRLFTYGPEPNFHKACFDYVFLEQHVRAAGFRATFRTDLIAHERGHRHGPISLGIKGYKPCE